MTKVLERFKCHELSFSAEVIGWPKTAFDGMRLRRAKRLPVLKLQLRVLVQKR